MNPKEKEESFMRKSSTFGVGMIAVVAALVAAASIFTGASLGATSSPTLAVTAPGTGTAGTAIAASSISGVFAGSSGAGTATGTITFKVFGPQASAPSTCTSGGTTVGTATAAGNGTYHPNAGFTPSQAGNYWWYASYPSDANNNAATSTCGSGMAETVIGKASPTLSATAPPTGGAGDRDRWLVDQRRPWRELGWVERNGNDHVHGVRAAGFGSVDLRERGHNNRDGDNNG